jgi:acyl-CoA thioesterase
MSFDADTALRPAGDGVHEGTVDGGWWTPRGPLGGYVMAIVLRGLEETVGDRDRMVRSLAVSFMRPPAAGLVTVRATIERAVRSLTTVSGRLEQDGRPMALAIAAFSVPWEGPLLDDAPMPEVDPPEGFREARAELPEGAPPFLDKVSMQQRFGPPPLSGADRAEVGGWIGLREERQVDSLALVTLADAWFPAAWARLRKLAPAPTIDLTIHFRAPLPLDHSLVLARFRTRLVRDGFFEEDGELWAPDGTLVAQSRQLGLLIGAEA